MTATTIGELVAKMNALTDEPLLDAAAIERQIVARDREIANPFTKDLQVTAIHGHAGSAATGSSARRPRTASSTRGTGRWSG